MSKYGKTGGYSTRTYASFIKETHFNDSYYAVTFSVHKTLQYSHL